MFSRRLQHPLRFAIPILLAGGAAVPLAWAGNLPQQLGLRTGREIYHAACAACHGPTGNGAPQAAAGFDKPSSFPHFDKCDETTPEYTRDWKAVIRDGGPGRGFSQIMPSFRGVLDSQQMDRVIEYLRSLCSEKGWPVGELNVPLALVTEKAFPESETVLTTSVNAKGPPGVGNTLIYEQILDKLDQLEVAVPVNWNHRDSGGYTGGIGDVAVGVKHVLSSHLNGGTGPLFERTGSILSVQAEVVLATGDQTQGLGSGQTSVGGFAAYDVLLPRQVFLEFQAGADVPLHSNHGGNAYALSSGSNAAYFRTALGKNISGDENLGRLWSPMIEFVADRNLNAGAVTDWDAVAEFEVTLNRRQHVRAAAGYRIPINDTLGRSKQILFYFLWDWFDGGLLEGW
jgi:mono/diheme cytochrome c family protein